MQTMKEIFEEIEASGGLTPSRRLKDIANRFPEQVAFRDKRYGIWNEITSVSYTHLTLPTTVSV